MIKFCRNFYYALIFLAGISVILISCGGATHQLSKGEISEKESYIINSYYGCCGCEAKYFNIMERKRKAEQIIYYYTCYAKGNPTKFVFNYNKIGQITSCSKYVATTSSDYLIKLTEAEKEIFTRIDSSSVMKPKFNVIPFSQITGFRKPVKGEVSHSFPLIKNGGKVTVL